MKPLVALVMLLGSMLAADIKIPQKGSNLRITIYNNDLAFVEEHRSAKVPFGEARLVYEGVPASVITPSVVPVFGGVPVSLYSQNYIYDLISLDAMLRKSINHTVSFMTNGTKPRLSHGKLLSAAPNVMIRESESGRIVSLEKPTQVLFHEIPESMITRPSLVWHIDAKRGGMLDIDLKYLTRGIGWKSDYVLDLGEKRFDLTGWITVDNHSGVAYEKVQITCLAGALHMAETAVREPRVLYKSMPAPTAAPVNEEAFAGYHIYKIPFRETIANKQQKQILFLHKQGVPYREYGRCVNSYFENYGTRKLFFDHVVSFENSKKSRLGLPLPAGTVRLYQEDSRGESHFIGEQRIGDTPEDERVKLTVGRLFDATGEKRITRFVARKHHREVETTYTLHNRGKTPLQLRIEERIPVYGDHIELKSSCKGICKVEKKNAFTQEFTVALAPKESYSFTSEFVVEQ